MNQSIDAAAFFRTPSWQPQPRGAGLWMRYAAAIAISGFFWSNAALADADVALSDRCPPSFELAADSTCRLRSLYETYGMAQGHGGTQTSLPPARQEFTPQQIDLGRILFFDPLLSSDGNSSCAHCHHPDYGLSDGQRTAAGFGAVGHGPARTGGESVPRRSPTVWNVTFLRRLFWDGRAASLEEQAEGPLFAPNEMNNTRESLEARINDNATYRRLFAQAFPESVSARVDTRKIAVALAAFQSTLISLNSRYDRYAHGDRSALTPLEIHGLNVFRGFVSRCSQCHTPPLFTNDELAVIGAPPVPGRPIDVGAGKFSSDPRLRGAFKVPTLRNVTRSGPPYFQAGQLSSLNDVVNFYNARRGHALPPGEKQSLHWHVHMVAPKLGKADVKAIVAFLATLEDESMLPVVPAVVPSGLPVVSVRGTRNGISVN